MKVMDERMACAVGPRGHKHNVVGKRSIEKVSEAEVAIQAIEPTSGGGDSFGGGGDGPKWRVQMPSSSSIFVGPLSCSIILFLIALAVFGLEIYRIREVNDLAQRTEILEKDLDVLRSRTSRLGSNYEAFKLSNEDEIDVMRVGKDEEIEIDKKQPTLHLLEDAENTMKKHHSKRSLNRNEWRRARNERRRWNRRRNSATMNNELKAAEFQGFLRQTENDTVTMITWEPAKWMSENQNRIQTEDRLMTIVQGGLYFVYTQISITNEEKEFAYVDYSITVNSNGELTKLIRCSTLSEQQKHLNCFAGRTIAFYPGDTVYVENQSNQTITDTSIIIGFIPLGNIADKTL